MFCFCFSWFPGAFGKQVNNIIYFFKRMVFSVNYCEELRDESTFKFCINGNFGKIVLVRVEFTNREQERH